MFVIRERIYAHPVLNMNVNNKKFYKEKIVCKINTQAETAVSE